MATIKNTANSLGNLIQTINNASAQPPQGGFSGFGSVPTQSSIGIDDDSIPSNMLDAAPVFTMNYKAEKKQCIRKAKAQLQKIVREVVPQVMQTSAMIVDKIEQDAEQLGNLYFEQVKSELMEQTLMDTIGRGETNARMFEVFNKHSKELRDLNNLITETQNQMRKYYIDTYLDLQQKDEAEEASGFTLPINTDGVQGLPQPAQADDGQPKGQVIIGTDQTAKMIQAKKLEAIKAKYNEVKE